jgi:uncharacterized protein DUF6455
MFIEFCEKRCGTFVRGFLNRVMDSVARRNEMRRLDLQEVEAIARELQLSSIELTTLALSPSRSVESLNRRLSHAGFSENELAASHGDILRDLRRVCSQCASKARCARDLKRERRAAPAKYCPNEQTLRALADEAPRGVSPILPLPALRS